MFCEIYLNQLTNFAFDEEQRNRDKKLYGTHLLQEHHAELSQIDYMELVSGI